MATKRFPLLAISGLMAAAFSLWLSTSHAEEDQPSQPSMKLVQSAKATFEATMATYDLGRGTAEEVYRWSRRLMDAELRDDAANSRPKEDHLARMRKLHERVSALNRFAHAGGETVALMATEFYVAEAELELGK